MFKKVLIANRGAIAVRIERTLKKMEIPSVAIYTKADQDSLHVDHSDEAVLIGEGNVQESYLHPETILQAALDTSADAIHPGYGFLSENAQFARTCEEKGITFIGPTPGQMELFGLKHSAREAAANADVPLLPGTNLLQHAEEAVAAAADIGYPVMLKSTAGGGGIGMRICKDKDSLLSSFDAVTHLAENNFNDGGLFLEKYISSARHIEVQIFGNWKGDVVSLGERDCSIQRRNQKVVEESPAPLLSEKVRKEMAAAAERLASATGYQNAGTVEFLYDPDSEAFYFLEMNTRLQVEHGVTEEVTGVDLVEWMILEAARELPAFPPITIQGHSIQARVYAEDSFHDFRPSVGQIDRVELSSLARNECWVRDGLQVTTLYDPMLAKVIVHSKDRDGAIKQLSEALSETKMYGVTTNLLYVKSLLQEPSFQKGEVHTQLLNSFSPSEMALEVIDGGIQTTIQDWPGRVGHWDVGVPPCGPMDPLSFRIGNQLLQNDEKASGLELTLQGGSYSFREDIWFCITGADMQPALDGTEISLYHPILARKGQILSFGQAESGMRTYLLVSGGFDMPQTLNSASTFTLGGFGGHGGRALRAGDVLRVNGNTLPAISKPLAATEKPAIQKEWTIGVVPGPHCTEEFLLPAYLKQLEETEWEVHFNSSRTGVRLIGPAPLWAREDGGEAGLHPSNIHDNAYAVGTLDLTGDMPILLGPDGPSLGGFVCPVTTASAEFWKIGQLHAGDTIRFQLLTLNQAETLRLEQEAYLKTLREESSHSIPVLSFEKRSFDPNYPILAFETEDRRFPITVRCSGDENVLVEYGEMELDLLLRFQVQVLMEAIRQEDDFPIMDLTPGIRSLQIRINPLENNVQRVCEKVLKLDKQLPALEDITIPSRIVKLPLSWDDPSTQLATERYQKNVRPDAPWCPDNLEFIRRINGLDSINNVKDVVFDANYLVMGLGDVYLGAPVATPTDPRHRLVTTKYNPARTWTPENAVGIGGAYMCVYGMEGPGGYQFVGRTIQMWNKFRETKSFEPGKPWLLRFFDQIQYYPVSADELLELREDFLRGRFEADITETTFSLKDYIEDLQAVESGAAKFKHHQQKAFQEERQRWKEQGLAEYASEQDVKTEQYDEGLPEGTSPVTCSIPGSVWKVLVENGSEVKQGETLIIEESMKMEFIIEASCDGYVTGLSVKPGDEVHPGQTILGITEKKEVSA